VVSGPSGVGKTTVVTELLKVPGITRSISATTRAARGQEVHGRDYFFMTMEQFDEGVRKGDFLEHAMINGKRYGTPRTAVEASVAAGRVVLLAIDVQGAAALRAMKMPFVGVFLLPPSMEELERRILGRGDTPPEEARRRLALAKEEVRQAGTYDVQVTNVTVAETVRTIVVELKKRQILQEAS
jgi:guanylate kinase